MFEASLALPLLWPLVIGFLGGACSGPFRGVTLEVSLGWSGSPMRRVIDVQFSTPGDCFVIPDGTSVALNGVPLKMVSRGRKISDTSTFVRVKIPAPTCEPALFRSEPFEAAGGTDRIEVEMKGHMALVELAGLRERRSLRLAPGPIEPGREIVLDWLPTSDVWPDEIIGAEVHVAASDIGQIVVADPNMQLKGGRFRFRMPDVRPGPVTLSVRSGATRPRVRVTKCRGFDECVGGEVDGPEPIPAEVLPRASAARH